MACRSIANSRAMSSRKRRRRMVSSGRGDDAGACRRARGRSSWCRHRGRSAARRPARPRAMPRGWRESWRIVPYVTRAGRGFAETIEIMALDKATVARIATLARIRLPEAELEPLAGELSQILDLGRAAERGRHRAASRRWRASPQAACRCARIVVTDGDRREAILGNAPRDGAEASSSCPRWSSERDAHRADPRRGARRARGARNSRRASWPRRISPRSRRRGRSTPSSPRRRSGRSPWPTASDARLGARRGAAARRHAARDQGSVLHRRAC